MSLRARLLWTVLTLLALGLVGAALATYVAARADLTERADDQLRAAGHEAARLLDGRELTDPVLDLPVPRESVALWRRVADGGGSPSFFQIREPSGEIVRTVALGTLPQLPDDLAPAETSPDGERFRSVDVEQAGWRLQNWRFRTAWLSDKRGYLIVGMRTTGASEFAGELVIIQLVVNSVVLVVMGLLGWHAVRRGMRPLDTIAGTASAIGAGDLTRRVARADTRTEVGRLGSALNAMLTQIESAFRQREVSEQRLRRFVADASHELRTPVATIRGYAELFRRGAADRPDDLATAMRRIESEAERMGLLVDELLLLARLDQGRPLEQVPVDLGELAEDAIAGARAVAPDRPLELEVTGRALVRGDPVRIRQILDNLLTNVRRHTPAGTPATVRVTHVEGMAVIEVSDHGPGMSEEVRTQAFERFYRADEARSRDHGGAGLGLSIVAAVAGAHGGDATIHRGPGDGTTVRVRLPHTHNER